MVNIRAEHPGNIAAIRDVISRACRAQEASLVDTLRSAGAATLSLVATLDDRKSATSFTAQRRLAPLPASGLAKYRDEFSTVT
jgi:predicted N-acetyltransferase YhbS